MKGLTTFIFVFAYLHTSIADDPAKAGAFYGGHDLVIFHEQVDANYYPACKLPFRSVAGGRFENLTPLFAWLTNTANKFRGPRPLTNWAVVHGRITAINSKGIILDLRAGSYTTPGYGDTAHLVNHPDQSNLVDGKYLFVIAEHVGRIQYRDVHGETVTVPSFDFGRAPTPDELAGARSRTNMTKDVMSPNVTNLTITPRR